MVQYLPEDPDGFVDEIEQQIRGYVLRVMPPDPSGELEASPLNSLLLTYGNWRSRFVHTHPRAVYLSSKLRASPQATKHKATLAAISAAVEAGHDLTPYLSRRIKTAYVPKAQRDKRLHGRSDLDLLISDWGLHHLHLATQLEPDGFVKGTDDVLFAAFTNEDAYLIGIHPHGNWVLRELVEVLVREWPDNSAVTMSLSGVKLACSISEDDHMQLRKGGVAPLMEVDGRVVMPGQGMTTAGTPFRVTSRVNKIAWALTDLRENLDAQLSARRSVPGRWGCHRDLEAVGRRRHLVAASGQAARSGCQPLVGTGLRRSLVVDRLHDRAVGRFSRGWAASGPVAGRSRVPRAEPHRRAYRHLPHLLGLVRYRDAHHGPVHDTHTS